MKYLLNETKSFRCDNEAEAEAFLQELKQKDEYDIVSSTIARKELKAKGEIIESWVRLTVKAVYNDEKEPISAYYERT